jgi:hypothetical protein
MLGRKCHSVAQQTAVLYIFLNVLLFNNFRNRRPMPIFQSCDLADIFSGDELFFDALPLWKGN